MKTRFISYTDEQITEHIQIAKDRLQELIDTRDFDIHIVMMGLTLIDLEEEQKVRKSIHYT